jgi:hypothetical protein
MQLPNATVTAVVGRQTAPNRVDILLTGSATALYVVLTCGVSGRFSDNALMLERGKPRTVEFVGWAAELGAHDVALLRSSLRVEHLAQHVGEPVANFERVVARAQKTDDNAVLAQSKNNPHLFSWRGMNVLAGTPDHYGAVINLDFDFVKYLDTLAGSNHTVLRVWSGVYREVNASQFGIHHNTLNPAPGRYITPWERSNECCYSDGGNKFDLSKFSEAYMARLEAFVSAAAERSIAVELTLFSSMYPGTDTQWDASPLNAENNVNDVEAAAAAS